MVILDSRRGAFAARDPSGSETLFYRIADDGEAPGPHSHAPRSLAAPPLHGATHAWHARRPCSCRLWLPPSSSPAHTLHHTRTAPPPAGSAAFASSRAAIPEADPEAAGGDWLELPPGHYIAGRTPKLHQFALTPEQLQVRAWTRAACDCKRSHASACAGVCMCEHMRAWLHAPPHQPHAPRNGRRLSRSDELSRAPIQSPQVREMCEDLGPLAALAKRRSSLDNNGGRGARPADGDLFGFDEDA